MSAADFVSSLNRRQQRLGFKVGATILIVVLAVIAYSSWLVYMNAPATIEAAQESSQVQSAESAESDVLEKRVDVGDVGRMLSSRDAYVAVGVGILLATAMSLLVIWLGISLTYLGLALLTTAVTWPLFQFEATHGFGRLTLGTAALAASFAALMQGARLLLSGHTPILAVARNVLNEAVRMKISLIFIVLLIVLLAGLPGVLNEAQPLRFRVQSFMQYSVSGAFWTLALMTVFFSAATIAFDQRDRVIWQTMCKPVNPVEYLFGKWLGVSTLNAVLLIVCASGVFLFIEYLAGQRAQGEVQPYVPSPDALVVEVEEGVYASADRALLRSQVLVARRGVEAQTPTPDEALIESVVEDRTRDLLSQDTTLVGDPRAERLIRAQARKETIEQIERQMRSVSPGAFATFTFTGLDEPRRKFRGVVDRRFDALLREAQSDGQRVTDDLRAQIQERAERQAALEVNPLTFRYLVNAGADDPTALYRMFIRFSSTEGESMMLRQAALNTSQTVEVSPALIGPDGELEVTIGNGDPTTGRVNPMTMRFPPDGLEMLYVVGGYEVNFLRVALVMWVKLIFLAAMTMAAATFVSFPVACMFGLLVLICGETAGFLMLALDEYQFINGVTQEFDPMGTAFRIMGFPIAWAFQTYNELRPAERLVDGRLISWASLAWGAFVMCVWVGASLLTGWAIFRRRELALYSGH